MQKNKQTTLSIVVALGLIGFMNPSFALPSQDNVNAAKNISNNISKTDIKTGTKKNQKSNQKSNQQVINQISSQLSVNYQVIDNHAGNNGTNCATLGADWASCNQIKITLTNTGKAIKGTGWAIYFPNIRQILRVDHPQFKITHITGDLHKLEPTDQFTGFQANQAIEIPAIGEYWQLFQSDIMPRWYVSAPNTKAKVIQSTNTENVSRFSTKIAGDQWKRNPSDNNIVMTTINRFEKNKDTNVMSAQALRGQILPTPLNIKIHAGNIDLASGVSLNLKGITAATLNALQSRFKLLGVKLNAGYVINSQIDASKFKDKLAVSGSYTLEIGKEKATIVGFDEAGIFYGAQSILSLIPATGQKQIAMLDAQDAPRFEYRGMFLDVARNFHSKAAVLRLLDQMAAYKLNKFHFHLSDDEGWRLEIPGLPELTEVGSKRCHDLTETKCLLPQLGSGPDANNNGSGYFSRKDYMDIIQYANARHIEVIPEIDMPAHARAAVVSMEARYQKLLKAGKETAANEYRLLDPTDTSNTTSVQFYNRMSYLNPCLESSNKFVDKIIAEVAQMHKQAGQPLKTWHFGGDEAKNIRLGAGYEDLKALEKVAGKGLIDQSIEDKPWGKSAACQKILTDGKVADIEHLSSYFAVKASEIIDKHGIEKMQAWQDGLKHAKDSTAFKTKRVGVNFWDTLYWGGFESINEWAAKGFEVIVSNPDYVYMDMPYEVYPDERGYYWATRFSDERKIFGFAPNNMPQNAETSVDRDGNHFTAKGETSWPGAAGISGHSWSETVRTDAQMEYMIYPRLLPLAERAWHRATWELDYEKGREFKGSETKFVNINALNHDWERFSNILGQRELAKLDKAKIQYRLPVPGAYIQDGVLHANTALPGLTVQYSMDNGKNWMIYDGKNAPKVNNSITVRSVTPNGLRYSREQLISPQI